MRLLSLLAVSALLLAGCASDAPTEPTPDDDGLSLTATKDTGIIRGVVVNPSIVPIADVTVRIAAEGLETTTNENGAFGFEALEPGVYFVEASRAGYGTVQSSATVVAGVERPPAISIVLSEDPSQLPTVVELKWDGYMVCGLSVIALCGVADDFTEDNFITTHEVDAPGVAYLQSEMLWDSTQAVSPNMWLWQEATGDGGCSFDNPQGPSPIVINTTYGDYGKYGDKACFDTLGNTTDVRLRVFSGSIDGTRPPINDGCYPLVITELCSGLGATAEQEFTVFTHIFYGFKPFEGWQFSVDGSPGPA